MGFWWMAYRVAAGFLVVCMLTAALDDGLARTPPQAWTSWDLCRFDVNATLIKQIAEALESTGLKALGWDTLQIDEGWEACAEYDEGNWWANCRTPAPRDARGWIVANSTKFPGGIKPLAQWLHVRGFKIGIYTSASMRACGGNWGSRGHEAADAAAFAEWGVDWVKVDNCRYGSWADLIQSQRNMSAALRASGRPMIIQVGAGDHVPLLLDPNASVDSSYARTFKDTPWVWGPDVSHMWYTGNDLGNSWSSTVHNVLQNYRGAQYSQRPGSWNFAGDLWCGTVQQPGNSSMSLVEERATYALWTIMAAPLMIGCDMRRLSPQSLAVLSNPELLAINQDAWGVQGSVVALGDGSQIIAKPLSNGTFALALWNLAAETAMLNVSWGVLTPHSFNAMAVRDVWARRDLGIHVGGYAASVPGHGVALIKATPK